MSDSDPVIVPDHDESLALQRKIQREQGEGVSEIPTPEDARKEGLLRKVEDDGA